jgi:hypothetical protein
MHWRSLMTLGMDMACNNTFSAVAAVTFKIQRDSKGRTQFRTSVLPELFLVCE